MATKKKGGQPKNKNAEKWTEAKAIELGDDLIRWMVEKPSNWMWEKFLIKVRGHHPCTISYLVKKYESFSKLIKKANKIQEINICEYADNKHINVTMGIFILKNKHKWTDRVDQTSNDEKVDNKIQVEIIRNE